LRADRPGRAVPAAPSPEGILPRIAPAAGRAARHRVRIAMALSRTNVERIAHLARLEIDAGETEAVRAKLEAIFGLIDELNAVDTRGVLPMAHAQDLALPLRDDAVTEPDRHALYQGQAPAVEDGLYLVPKVIE
jgi:aspartyl-tRNA(Asn)/glutamyl-tRNA(Gln) amidotransferase subunit C